MAPALAKHGPDESPAIDTLKDVPPYSAQLEIGASRAQVIAALSDTAALSRWIFMSESAYAIQEETPPLRTWVHLYMKSILGEAHQDVVLRVSAHQSTDKQTISINLDADPDRLPSEADYKRITRMGVHIDVTALGPKAARVQMTVQVVPAIPVPPMIQPMLGIGPQKSLAYLQQLLASGQYSAPEAVLMSPRVKRFFQGISI